MTCSRQGFLVREPLEKLADRKLAGDVVLFHDGTCLCKLYSLHSRLRQLESLRMAMDFMAATEALFERVKIEDLATELGCSPNSVKQAPYGRR